MVPPRFGWGVEAAAVASAAGGAPPPVLGGAPPAGEFEAAQPDIRPTASAPPPRKPLRTTVRRGSFRPSKCCFDISFTFRFGLVCRSSLLGVRRLDQEIGRPALWGNRRVGFPARNRDHAARPAVTSGYAQPAGGDAEPLMLLQRR